MLINCPNKCSDARLEEVITGAVIYTPVITASNSGVELGNAHTDYSTCDKKYQCTECGLSFGDLTNDEILELAGKQHLI